VPRGGIIPDPDPPPVAPGEWNRLESRQESLGKGEETRTQKPFIGTLRVNESRPAERASSRKRVLRGTGVTRAAKRRQRVLKPRH
jgi:hypothetical protein